jgi:hypothetical protein
LSDENSLEKLFARARNVQLAQDYVKTILSTYVKDFLFLSVANRALTTEKAFANEGEKRIGKERKKNADNGTKR